MAAAVADFRPAERVAGKLDRRRRWPGRHRWRLVANPDLLAELGRKRAAEQQAAPLLVGFAAEVVGAGTGDALEARARAKLKEKGCDVVIANDVGAAGLGFDSDRNAVTLVFAGGPALSLGPAAKAVLAEQIWAALLPLVPEVSEEAPTAVRTLRLARRPQPPNDGPTGGPT